MSTSQLKHLTNMLDIKATSIDRLEFSVSQDNIIFKYLIAAAPNTAHIQLSLCHRPFKIHSFGKAKEQKKRIEKLMNELTFCWCFFFWFFLASERKSHLSSFRTIILLLKLHFPWSLRSNNGVTMNKYNKKNIHFCFFSFWMEKKDIICNNNPWKMILMKCTFHLLCWCWACVLCAFDSHVQVLAQDEKHNLSIAAAFFSQDHLPLLLHLAIFLGCLTQFLSENNSNFNWTYDEHIQLYPFSIH